MSEKEKKDLLSESLSSSDREYMTEQGWEKISDVMDSYKELEKNSIKLPIDDDEESWREFYTKVGCPEDPKDYEFCLADLPEDFPCSEEFESLVRKWSYRLGLSLEQAKKLHSLYVNYAFSKYQDACKCEEESFEEAKRILRMKWGKDYQKNVELGRSAMQYLGGKNLPALLEVNGLGNHPEVIETFVKLGQMLQEDRAIPGSDLMNLTQDQALEERKKLQSDPNFFRAYLDSSDPNHENSVMKMQIINKIISSY